MNCWSLVSEDKENLSMGRCSFWVLLLICIVFWSIKKPFPDTLYYLTLYSLLFNYGKKLVKPLEKFLDAKSPKELTKSVASSEE